MSRVRAQAPTSPISLERIMRHPAFARGFADIRAGRAPDFDNPSLDDAWFYERGRHFGQMIPLSVPLRIKGRINPDALRRYRKADEQPGVVI